jgi:hypothetical protein
VNLIVVTRNPFNKIADSLITASSTLENFRREKDNHCNAAKKKPQLKLAAFLGGIRWRQQRNLPRRRLGRAIFNKTLRYIMSKIANCRALHSLSQSSHLTDQAAIILKKISKMAFFS